MGHAHAAVIAHGAALLAKVLHAQQRQGLEVGAFFLKHGLHLATLGAVDALGRPVALPVLQELVLGLNGFKAFALQGGGLGVADGVLHRALAVGVTHAGRVGYDAVVGQGGAIHGVELRLVEVGLEYAFLEVVEHHVLGAAAEVAKGLLVQLCPHVLTGLPHHPAKAAPGVAQCGYEQARPLVAWGIGGAGHQGECALAVVDLHLLPGKKGQAVKLLGLFVAQGAYEAFDGVVGAGEAVQVDQVLVDGGGVAAQAQLGFDEFPVDFAQTGGGGGGGRGCGRSRWPGWGNLSAHKPPVGIGGRDWAGGHPGGICEFGQPAGAVAAYGFAVDAGNAGDFAPRGVAL